MQNIYARVQRELDAVYSCHLPPAASLHVFVAIRPSDGDQAARIGRIRCACTHADHSRSLMVSLKAMTDLPSYPFVLLRFYCICTLGAIGQRLNPIRDDTALFSVIKLTGEAFIQIA